MRPLTRDKRKIAECLLMAGGDVFSSISEAAEHAALGPRLYTIAVASRVRAQRDSMYSEPPRWGEDAAYSVSCLEAAYRLIESSAQLRREFFGR